VPETLGSLAIETVRLGDAWNVTVADTDVRTALDAAFDAGTTVVALNPRRDSLEEYFARMLDTSVDGGAR